MAIDEPLLILIAGMVATGAFLVLTFCASYIQVQKAQLQIMAVEAEKQKQRAKKAAEIPIEVS